jgi:dTDP-glucose 4,6-dehydratase
MKILVLGSLGTLGTPLVRNLRLQGHEIFESDVRHSDRSTYMRCDIRQYRQLERVLDWANPDLVYLLAAEFGRLNGEEYYEDLWSTNVIGTRHVLELQKLHQFKLIFASSSEVYGDTVVDEMYEDLINERAIEHHNDYAITKYVNEKQCLRFNKLYKNQIMILRFFNAYGPGELYHPYRSVVCLFCYRMLKNLPITIYKNYHRVFMYIDDFIETLSRASTDFINGGVINVGGTEYRSIEDLYEIISLYLNKKGSVQYISKEMANVVNKKPSIEKAVKFLGHNPITSLEKGVPLTIEWMKKEYSL